MNSYTFCGALNILYQKIKDKYQNKPIIVITPLHRLDEDSEVNEWGLPTKAPLEKYVDTIIETAHKFSLKVLDLYHLEDFFPIVKGNKDKFFFDGLHPNDLGHEYIALKLLVFLQENYTE